MVEALLHSHLKITGAFSWVSSALNYFEMLQDSEETLLSYLFLVSKE